MKLLCATTILALGLGATASADVTVKQTSTGKGLGLSGTTSGATFIKGNKMRTDVVMGDKTQTSVYDLDAQKMYVFDSKKKEADVWDMGAFADEISKSVDVSSTKASLKPNGQSKTVGGKSAAGYDLDVSMQAAFAGSKDMNMTVTLTKTTPAGPMSRWMYIEVASPSKEGFVAMMTSETSPFWSRTTSSRTRMSSGPMPSIGFKTPCRTWY